jgi:small subunit ribosomal protein S4
VRYTGPVVKLMRREGVDLGLKRWRRITRLNQPPGMRPKKIRSKPTEYGIRLREKQKLKRIYQISETQMRRYFEKASRQKKMATGDYLIQLLERRLDNVIYRMGFAATRRMARQMVTHGHVRVNGRKTNIPSFLVDPGEEIEVSQKMLKNPVVQQVIEETKKSGAVPSWLEVDFENGKGRVLALPDPAEANLPVNTQLIVEFYSR